MVQWFIVILLMLLSIILPPLALWWLSQRSPVAGFISSLAGVAPTLASLLGVLFSLNLVFVCNEIWQSRENAKAAMSRESDSLRNISRIASNIPDGEGLPVLAAARSYLEAVREFDFPLEQADDQSPVPLEKTSVPAIINLSDAVLNARTLNKLHPSIQPLLIDNLVAVRDKRRERLSLMDVQLSRVKWLSLLFLELATLLSIAVIHVTNGRALVVACMLFLGSVNPFLTALYASKSPFRGLDPVGHGTLTGAFDRVKSMEDSYKKKWPPNKP